MSFNFRDCSIEELWKYVASELSSKGVDVVLVGGAVVSIYTEGAYKSGDLDFVLNDFSREKLNKVMNDLGFLQRGRHYTHPDCKHLFIEFASFPVSIGNDYNLIPEEFEVNGSIIKIYSPTDCVRDRLSSYIHFSAHDCLDQAVLVANRHPVDLQKIKHWCKLEGGEKEWENFNKLLTKK